MAYKGVKYIVATGLLFLGAVFLLVYLYNTPNPVAQGPVASLSKGETLFNKRCMGCHGMKGSGTETGPPLVHRIYHPGHHSDMAFYLAMERGVRAHHWGFGDMPRIDGVTKEETDLIISYVRHLQKEAGIF